MAGSWPQPSVQMKADTPEEKGDEMNKLMTLALGASLAIGSALAADQKAAPAAKTENPATEKKPVKKHTRKHTKKAAATANAAAPAAPAKK
jgi:hypothetical protein